MSDTRTISDFLYSLPKDYTAIRVTCPRDDDKIKKVMAKEVYCYGYETSQKGISHYHIMMVGKITDTMKKAFHRLPSKYWSEVNRGKGFAEGVSYTIKSKDIYASDAYMQYYVGIVTPWVFGGGSEPVSKCLGNTEPRTTKAWMLTDRNLIGVLRQHCDDNDLGKIPFREALAHLFENTRWRAGSGLRNGIDPLFEEEFDNSKFAMNMANALMHRGTMLRGCIVNYNH